MPHCTVAIVRKQDRCLLCLYKFLFYFFSRVVSALNFFVRQEIMVRKKNQTFKTAAVQEVSLLLFFKNSIIVKSTGIVIDWFTYRFDSQESTSSVAAAERGLMGRVQQNINLARITIL